MLPMTVLRRLDCVLEPTKEAVLAKCAELAGGSIKKPELILCRLSGVPFYNISRYTLEKLKGDPDNILANFTNYIKSFSPRAEKIIEYFEFEKHLAKLEEHNILFLLVSKFCEIDLHPDKVSNIQMGNIFEELIRKFSEVSKEEAGDHFTPRDIVRLMVDLLFMPDSDILTTKGIIKTLYDPACGTGGMLSISEDYLRELNPDARFEVFGQDNNGQTYAICGSDMMIKGQQIDHIAYGSSFTKDAFPHHKFDYMLANPPFGVKWETEKDAIRRECEEQGFGGRFGAGLPRIDEGSLLFLQHMISKMKDPKEGGTRLAIVFDGSPLFTGSAGSGESEIRRWILENDWLEAIVAMPDQLFYRTGINTYLWIITNRKQKSRKGKIQLIDATSYFKKMRKSLGQKRHEICEEQRAEVGRIYGEFCEGEHVRIFDTSEFGYYRITVERPLKLNFAITDERLDRLKEAAQFASLDTTKKRKDTGVAQAEIAAGQKLQVDIITALEGLRQAGVVKNRDKFAGMLKEALKEHGIATPPPLFKATLLALSERDETADVCTDAKGIPEPDSDLRDYENVPFKEDVQDYFAREVLPHVPEAWISESKTKVGYEISFNRYFYKYIPLRPLEEIDAELERTEKEIAEMLAEMTR